MITTSKIIDAVSAHFAVPRMDLISARRDKYLSEARFAAYHLCREMTPFSYPQIGRAFRRDHTTVMNGIKRAAELMSDADFAKRVERARETAGSDKDVDNGFIVLLEKFSVLAAEAGYTITITRAA
jgi:hypothetical protein